MRCSTSQDLLQSGGNMRFIEAFIYCFGSLKGTTGSALLCRTLRRQFAFLFYRIDGFNPHLDDFCIIVSLIARMHYAVSCHPEFV